jgi:replicative DNA helicase
MVVRESINESYANSPMPHSAEAEKQLLGCLILQPELIDEAVISLKSGDFYDLRHGALYELMVSMREKQVPVAMPSIHEESKSLENGIASMGGIAYVADLPNQTPSPAMYPYFLDIIKKKARLRKYQRGAYGVLNILNSNDLDDEARINEAGTILTPLLVDSEGGEEVTAKDIVREAIGQIEEAFTRKGECTGVPTGFFALDKQTGGLQKGDMIVLAARPSMGKTSLALNIAEHVSCDSGIPVGFLSLEMTSASLMKRILSSRANVNGHKLMNGTLSSDDIQKLTVASANVAKAPLHINDRSALSITEMAGICRRMVLKHGAELLIIDYLQLLQAKAESRTQEVSRISSAIKSIAKELGVPVLILSQLSRNVEAQDRMPRLSDLRDSGAIEQDADLVLFLSRDSGTTLTKLDIAKHRTGPTGVVELEWEPSLTKYSNPSYWMKNDAQPDPA